MAIDNIVWAVRGPDSDPQLAREEVWNNSGGQTGVNGPSSLEVRATPSPSGSVMVLPGGFTAAATPGGNVGYTSAPFQSYSRTIAQTNTVTINPTGSSGSRTDVIGIAIRDPQFEPGLNPPDLNEHQYWQLHKIENASAFSNRAHQFGLSFPFVPLARITVPPNRTVVNPEDITDIRFVARENFKLDRVVQRPTQSRTLNVFTTPQWVSLDQVSSIIIPQWATHVTIGGAIKGAAATGSGDVNGETRIAFSPGTGNKYTGSVPFNESNAWSRFDLPAGGTVALDDNDRGRRAFILFQVRRTSGNGGLSVSTGHSLYDFTVSFTENPTNA